MKTSLIINDLTNLLGAEVRVFGQPTKLESEVSNLLVDTREIFESLRDYEVDYIVSKLDYERIENLEELITQIEDAIDSTQDAIDSLENACNLFPNDESLKDMLESLESEKEKLEIQLDNYRDELSDAEDDYIETEVDDTDDYINELDEMFGMKESTCGNSYNWMGNVSNHFNYNIYECGDGYTYVELRAHRYGDVRANYTETALYKFQNECEFWECITEADHYETVEIDGEEYEFRVTSMSDTYEVWSVDGDYVCEAYGDDMDELSEKIKEKIA